MKRIDENALQTLIEIGEAIETLNLNDQASWAYTSNRLEKIIPLLPNEETKIRDCLSLCIEGLWAISRKKISDALSLIEALYEVMDSVIENISGNTNDENKIDKTKEALLIILKNERSRYRDNEIQPSDLSDYTIPPSLDDVAMMLIQLEPVDMGSFHKIKDALDKILKDQNTPKDVGSTIEKAGQKIQNIISKEIVDVASEIPKISELIDESMNMMNQNSKVEENKTQNNKPNEEDRIDLPLDEGEGIETDVWNHDGGDIEMNENQGEQEKSTNEIMDYMPEDADLEMLGEFIAESNDLITNAEEALLSLEVDPDDMDAVGMVFRAFHTIKGTSAFLELSLLSEMAHYAENLLSRVRDQEIRYSGGYADLSLKSLDMLKELIQLVEKALNGDALIKPEGYDELLKILTDPEGSGVSEEFDDISTPRVGDLLVAQGKVERDQLEEAVSNYKDVPVGNALVKSKTTKVSDVGQALRTQTKLKGTKQAVDSTVRVSTKRLDKLVDMVGEMVIAHSMVAQDNIMSESQHHSLLKKVTQTGKIVRELQDLSMSMRMVPLKSTFQKMARLVRDVARKVGKNVNLITEGEDTEIDRNLVDVINDPLVHMVRNSVDHGIEMPEERQQIGKSPAGTVKLSAYHSAGNVVVEINDDGKGLNKDLILAKAIERNLVESGKTLSDRDIYNLIFEPGFSTAQTVTDVSGRGVGMDVVRKNIETLRGQVEINSTPGKGSVFKIFLPLTLAIIDGMVVRVGSESYVIPTESIVRSIKPDPKNISHVFNEGEVLSIQGKLIPLFRLSQLYNIEMTDRDNSQALVVIIEDDTTQVGIIIDELVGRQQVVVKSLGETMKGIPGISGGAIMPNGRVGLIIDVGGLIRMVHSGRETIKEIEATEELQMAG